MKAVIVGAGIGGLTTALCLNRCGWDVELLEQAPSLSPVGAGIQISPNGARVLAALGVSEWRPDFAHWGAAAHASLFAAGWRRPRKALSRALRDGKIVTENHKTAEPVAPDAADLDARPKRRSKRREQQRAIETRRTILEAALNEFAERGFDGASMRHIGERAGLEYTLITYHFRNKDTLWRAVAEHSFEQIQALWDEAIPPDSQMCAAERVKVEFRTFLRFTLKHTAFHHFMLRENQGASPRLAWLVEKFLMKTINRVIPQIREAQAAGDLIQAKPALVYYMLIGMSSVLSSLNGEMAATIGFSLGDSVAVDEFWDLIERAIFH